MCVLSIKVSTRKKSGNLFNDPRKSQIIINKDIQNILINIFYFLKQLK